MSNRVPDKIDDRIIGILERDGRTSVVTIAKSVNLSRSAVQARIDRLEHEGFIAKYTIVRGAPGQQAAARAMFFLKMAPQRDSHRLLLGVGRVTEVAKLWSVTGETIDAIALVEARNVEEIGRIRLQLAEMDGISSVTTTILLKAYS